MGFQENIYIILSTPYISTRRQSQQIRPPARWFFFFPNTKYVVKGNLCSLERHFWNWICRKNQEFLTLRWSSVTGKPMEYWIGTIYYVYLWTGLDIFFCFYCEWLHISNLSLTHNVHDNLTQVFINPMGFTVERISNIIISQHFCGVDFGWNVEQSGPQKCPNYYCTVPFMPYLGSVVPLSFGGWYECFFT